MNKITIFELPYSEVINRGQREAITCWQFIFNRIILIASIMEEEIWKDIPDYEGLYQVSSLGRVKSIERKSPMPRNGKNQTRRRREIILKQPIRSTYLCVGLFKNGKQRIFSTHQLVAMAFLGHVPNGYTLVVNHKNFIRTDNRLSNIEVVTVRENNNHKHLKSTSIYTGVSWNKKINKWASTIHFDKKSRNIGFFENEYDAHIAYQNKLKSLTN